MTQDSRDQQVVADALAADAPAKLDAKAVEEPTAVPTSSSVRARPSSSPNRSCSKLKGYLV